MELTSPTRDLEKVPSTLKDLVHRSVALLGQVIERELGAQAFTQIEAIRQQMTRLRDMGTEASATELRDLYADLEASTSQERYGVALSFTLMLELMNTCENAYRNFILRAERPQFSVADELPKMIIYVLTAHPTEARSPQNIAVFHSIQSLLIHVLERNPPGAKIHFVPTEENALRHLLEIAWRTPPVRRRAPKVSDEAEHLYSLLFRDGILFSLLDVNDWKVPFFVRTWVGGDKDGHPGVDENVMRGSLRLSRHKLIHIMSAQLARVRETLRLFPSRALERHASRLQAQMRGLRSLQPGDGARVVAFKKQLLTLRKEYQEVVGAIHPALHRLAQIAAIFPGLVVPLELRESSDVLMAKAEGKGGKDSQGSKKKLAIERMLAMIARLSRGADPRWYARGFIVSMTESIEHIRAAAELERKVFKGVPIPVIPLFEEAGSLNQSDVIVGEMIADPHLGLAMRESWDGFVEMMVGYSDSAKEAGVLPSRLAIAAALLRLEKVCEKAKLTPLFFHGSGGSTDRGGGSIEDQTAWWPRSALRRFKVTLQGEMVERSFATSAIAKGQIEHILKSVRNGLRKPSTYQRNEALERFAARVAGAYRAQVRAPEFLQIVKMATPYSYLSFLKIGSRPTKRSKEVSVKGLRAIPWVLCWTQTRLLFPTWWGIGSAWEEADQAERLALRQAFKSEPVFTSYIKALGFTLAKVELAVWRIYLERSGLEPAQAAVAFQDFADELEKTLICYREICGQQDLMWFRPWLGQSIQLRSPMIHPLNLLQMIAVKNREVPLLRLTVTGISSGMMTTG